jgi:hypothetical protein
MIAERGKRRFLRQISGPEADMDKVDCIVIGAGVIGLAIGLFNYARRLDGLQLGVLNYAGNKRPGTRLLPIANFARQR